VRSPQHVDELPLQELDHARLLRAIGRALGDDTPYLEIPPPRADAIHLGTMGLEPSGAGGRSSVV